MLLEPFQDALRRLMRGRGWPGLHDLESGSVFIPEALLNQALSGLERQRRVIILGPEGRGKTTLASLVGLKELAAGRQVYVIDCASSGQTIEQITAAIVSRDHLSPLWILDDVQVDEIGMNSIYDQIEECTSSRFLYVCRKKLSKSVTDEGDCEYWLDELLDVAAIIQLDPDLEILKGITISYLATHESEERFSDRALLGRLTDEDFRHILEISGGNLRTVTSYLAVWDPRSKPLRSLSREVILDSIQKQRLRPLFGLGDDVLQAYMKVSVVYQFDIPTGAGVLNPIHVNKLKGSGLILEYGEGFFGLPHSSDARDVVEAFATMLSKKAKLVTDTILLEYLQGIETGVFYEVRLMKGISEAHWYTPSKAIRKHFSELAVNHAFLPPKTQYIRSFCKTRVDLETFLDRLGGKEYMKKLVGRTTMPKLRELLGAVRAVDEIIAADLESVFTIDDKVALYSRAKLSSLSQSLQFYSRIDKSRSFAKKILADVMTGDLAPRIARTSIAGCGRFVWVASKLDKSAGQKIADVIADHIMLKNANDAEDLSLLVNNLRNNESARQRLVAKVIDQCDPAQLLSHGNPDGYTFLLTSIADYYVQLERPVRALTFIDFLLLYFERGELPPFGDRALAAAIWLLVRMNRPFRSSLDKVSGLLAERIRKAEPENMFWLLWSAFQVDEDLFYALTTQLKPHIERHLGVSATLTVGELTTVGLLASTGITVPIHTKTIQVAETVSALVRHPHGSRILFALLGAKKTSEIGHKALHDALSADLGNLREELKKLISENPIPASKIYLSALLEELT